jgi:diacylglycerol kinase family enzyme
MSEITVDQITGPATPSTAEDEPRSHFPGTKPRMLLIVNPFATTVSGRLKNLVVYALRGRYDIEAVETQHPNHATELTRQAVGEGFDVVVSFGGDGTLNEAANGLAGSNLPLSVLPGGSTNVVCRMVGIPTDVVDATEHLLQLADDLEPRRIDMGRINGRHFIFSSGVGIDADVTRWVDDHPRLKARGGDATFTYAALRSYFRDYRGRSPLLEVEAAGQRVAGLSAIVQNSDPYTFFRSTPLRVCDDISMDDGTISLTVMRRASLVMDAPGIMYRLFSRSGRLSQHRQASSFPRIGHATIRSLDGTPLPVEVDGDYIGHSAAIVYEAAPGSLLLIA